MAEALATGCGSTSDLIIGRNSTAVQPTGGAPSAGSTGSAGEAAGLSGQAGTPALPDCGLDASTPEDGLSHHYSFDGTGTVAKDSVGPDDGELLSVVNGAASDAGPGAAAQLDGTGQLLLDGSSGYVNLPNHLISTLSSVTIVSWLKWGGGSGYQRIFDFGGGIAEDDTSDGGRSYFALSPYGGSSRLMLLAKSPNSAEVQLTSKGELKGGNAHQVAATFVSSSHLELYLDGVSLGRLAIDFKLSEIDDVNDWLGRSQYSLDNPYNGSLDDFRIYDRALTACEVAALYSAGPDSP